MERGLTLAEDKTLVTHIRDGFDFLGFNIRGFEKETGVKVFTQPSKDSFKGTVHNFTDMTL